MCKVTTFSVPCWDGARKLLMLQTVQVRADAEPSVPCMQHS